jgi:Domain of unknown function (DUF397)
MGTVDNADWRTSSFTGTNGNCVEIATWRKSTRSGTNGSCVEVGGAARAVLVRDTKDRDGTVLAVPARAWERFIVTVR